MSDRPGWPPPTSAMLAVGAVLAVLATAFAVQAVGSSGRADRAEERALAAEARAEELADQVADLRRELQTRQGELEDALDDLDAQDGLDALDTPATPGATPTATPTPTPAGTGDDAVALDAATVAELLAATPGATAAVHVTDVVDGHTLVGFDLTAALAAAEPADTTADVTDAPPTSAPAVRIRLDGIRSPAAGDCRHTQSRTLAEAWLEATDGNVLLRQPTGPQATGDGAQVAEVLALVDPTASLTVTMVVAGEAIPDGDEPTDDLDLAERLTVAQQSAQAVGRGVWGCSRSALLGTAPAPSPSPDPGASPDPSADPDADAAPDATPTEG